MRVTERRLREGEVSCALLLRILIALWIGAFLAPKADAHRDDYLNETFVFRTLDRGERELELWGDVVTSQTGSARHGRVAPAIEAGITDHLMADLALGFDGSRDARRFDRARVETRYRFGEEGRHLIDYAASIEYEWERDNDDATRRLTPRLVLNRDLRDLLNITVNLDATVDFDGPKRFTPGIRVGLRYPDTGWIRWGVEYQEVFAEKLEALLIPQIWFPIGESTLRIGFAKRITATGPEDYVRMGVEVGIH